MYWWSLSSCRTHDRIPSALSRFPLDSSHRGDSGMKNRPMKSRPQGISWMPKGMSHCEWFGSRVESTP